MWCTEVGREQAANKPLLRTVFQVMMSLFGPGRKKTLLFVIRDKIPETPLEKLKATLLEDIHKIWDEVPKPQEHESTHLSQCFQVMVANVRCDEIAKEIFNQLKTNQDWLELEKAVNTGIVKGFGKTVNSILKSCFDQYEMEAKFFDKTVKNTKRRDVLEKNAFELVHPAYTTLIQNIRSTVLEEFKVKLKRALDNNVQDMDASVYILTQSSITEFNQGCEDAAIKQDVDWDVAITRNKLLSDIMAHAHYETTAEKLKRVNLQNQEAAKKKIEEIRKQYEDNGKRLAKLQADQKGPLDFVGQIIVDAGNAVGRAVVDAANAVGGAAVDVANAVGGVAVDVGNAVGGVAVDATNAVGGAAADVGNAVGGAAVDVANAVGGVAVDVGSAVGGAAVDATNAVGGAVVDVGNAVGGAAVDVGNAVGGAAVDVVNAIGGIFRF